MVMLLGGIGGVIGDWFFVPEQKEIVVVRGSPGASSSGFVGSPLVNHGSKYMSRGAPSSPGGSFQRKNPSLVDEIGTLCHSLYFGAYAPG